MEVGSGVEGRGEAWRVLRHRDYRLLWLGQVVSLAGSQIQTVAIGWQVYELTGSAAQLGLLGLLRGGPTILLSLVGGVFADALDRRRLLLVTQGLLLLLSVGLALLTAAAAISVPIIYAVILLAGMANAFDNPARQATVPALVPREELTAALTLNITSWQVATVLGPALGGVIIAAAGVEAAYAIDALSFGAVIAALLLMRGLGKPSGAPALDRRGGFRSLVEDLVFVRANGVIMGVMALDFLATFFGSVGALLPIYARDVLGVGSQGYGLLYSAGAAGALAGGLLLSLRGRIEAQGPTLLVAVAVYGLCLAAFGVSRSFWLSVALLAGSGAADTVSTVLRGSILQLATPDELRGRATAVHQTFAAGGPQLGQLRAGIVAERFGPAAAAVSGGLACVCAVLAIAALVPKVRHYRP